MCMHVQPSRSPRLPPGPPPCRVRVVGGAYGGFCDFDTHSGMFTYSSYRDPNLLKTVDVYDGGRRHTRRAAVVMNHGARAAPQLRARTGCEHQARPPVWMLPGSRAAWGCGPCTRPPARGACIWFVTGAPKLELANPRCCLLPPAQAPSTSSPRWRCLTTSWPRPSSAPSATSTPTSCPVRRDAGVGPFAITDSLACGRAHRARFLATPSRPEPPCTAARARAHACLAPSSPRFPPRLQGPHRLHAPHPGRDRRGAPAAQVGQGWAGPGPLGPPFGDAVPAPLQVPPAFPSPTAPCSCCPDHSGCAAQCPPPPPSFRDEILATTVRDFREFGEVLAAVRDKGQVVAVTSGEPPAACPIQQCARPLPCPLGGGVACWGCEAVMPTGLAVRLSKSAIGSVLGIANPGHACPLAHPPALTSASACSRQAGGRPRRAAWLLRRREEGCVRSRELIAKGARRPSVHSSFHHLIPSSSGIEVRFHQHLRYVRQD